MSNLSVVLSDYFSTAEVTQSAFAATHGIEKGMLNRVVKGALTPGDDVVTRIVAHLPENWRPRATTAWLKDRLPRELREHVAVLEQSATISEAAPIPMLPTDLPPDTREHLLWLADMCILHIEIRQLVAALYKTLRATPKEPPPNTRQPMLHKHIQKPRQPPIASLAHLVRPMTSIPRRNTSSLQSAHEHKQALDPNDHPPATHRE